MVTLAIAYLFKRQCILHAWVEEFQYRRLCYNDLQPLFTARGISRALIPYRDVQLEYPVLTGAFMDLAGRLLRLAERLGVIRSADDRSYFQVSALMLAPFGLAVTMLLRPRVSAARLALWAASTPLILYAFHNWDLMAVTAAVGALVAFERKRDGWAGVAVAVGASAKLYPAFLLPAMILARIAGEDKKGVARLVLSFAGIYALLNVPVILFSSGDPGAGSTALSGLSGEVDLRPSGTNGWLGVWLFHSARYPDFGSLWFWLAHHGKVLIPAWDWAGDGYRRFVNLASLVMFAGATEWLLWMGWRSRKTSAGYPVVAVGLAVVIAFLVSSKVHSPQYALWVLPFLALLPIPWRWVVAYFAADAAVYVSSFYYFTVDHAAAPGWMGLLEISVWLRAAVLVGIGWAALRGARAEPEASTAPGPAASLAAS